MRLYSDFFWRQASRRSSRSQGVETPFLAQALRSFAILAEAMGFGIRWLGSPL